MSKENVKAFKRGLEAGNRGDVDALLAPAPGELGDAHLLLAGGDHVATVQLTAAAALGLAVDGDLVLGKQALSVGPGLGDAGQLEELAEPDGVAANLDLVHRG